MEKELQGAGRVFKIPCKPNHERKKKGKVVHWSKESSASLQGCLGDL